MGNRAARRAVQFANHIQATQRSTAKVASIPAILCNSRMIDDLCSIPGVQSDERKRQILTLLAELEKWIPQIQLDSTTPESSVGLGPSLSALLNATFRQSEVLPECVGRRLLSVIDVIVTRNPTLAWSPAASNLAGCNLHRTVCNSGVGRIPALRDEAGRILNNWRSLRQTIVQPVISVASSRAPKDARGFKGGAISPVYMNCQSG